MISSRLGMCRSKTTWFFIERMISNSCINWNYKQYSRILVANEFQRIHRFYSTGSNTKQKHPKQILKTPKGTCDHNPQQMALRQEVFGKIETIFQQYGAQAIDTPVFELKEVLTGKYGEDSKLIYDLADQGGELLSLRYDLTVPLARYLAMYKIERLKRYHIAKVYRRDSPSVAQGRHREFFQCDFDIVGSHDLMLPDVECIKVLVDILKSIDVGEFVIKLNHRQLLNGIFETCGVPEEKFKSICSAIDKLDKLSWVEVRNEMIEEKGLSENVADKIGQYTQLTGHTELIEKLLQDDVLNNSASAVKGLEELKLLLNYCNLLGVQHDVIVDVSLARGLDYYTGVIFEAVLKEKNVGSIAAGGRYDNLIGMFDKKGHSVPCVGISIGVERIIALLQANESNQNPNLNRYADVYVISANRGLLQDRLKLMNRLWNAGIRSAHSYKNNPRFLLQIQHCEKYKIPIGIIIGPSELERNVVKLRIISTRDEIDIPIDNLEHEIKKKIDELK